VFAVDFDAEFIVGSGGDFVDRKFNWFRFD